MKYVDQESTSGKMARSMRGSGSIIKCTAKGSWSGLKARSTAESSLKTGGTGLASSNGTMEENMKGSGKMENSTGQAFTEMLRERSKRESGMRGRGCDGQRRFEEGAKAMVYSVRMDLPQFTQSRLYIF